MKCPLCKGKMAPGKTNLPFSLVGGNVIVVINVPALVCDQYNPLQAWRQWFLLAVYGEEWYTPAI